MPNKEEMGATGNDSAYEENGFQSFKEDNNVPSWQEHQKSLAEKEKIKTDNADIVSQIYKLSGIEANDKELDDFLKGDIQTLGIGQADVVTGNDDGDGSQGAHQARVDSRSQHGNQALADGVGVLACAMHHRGGTHTGLVDKGGTPGARQGDIGKGAKSRLHAEGPLKDLTEHARNGTEVQRHDDKHENEVEHHHHGHNA